MRSLLILFFLFVFFSSCGDDTTQGVIPKGAMVSLLTDLHLADGITSTYYGDSASQKVAIVYKAIYKKYGTDSVAVRKSLSYYTERPEELELMYKQVEVNLLKLQKEEQAREERVQKEALRKIKLQEDAELKKAQTESNRLKMLKGEYDFGLPSYTSPADAYFNTWKMYPVAEKNVNKKVDTLKTDSLKRDSLLKKEQRKNDLPAKRIR